MRHLLPGLLASACLLTSLPAAAQKDIAIGYLEQPVDRGPVLSNLIPEPEDAGQRGAELGIRDSNASGRFLGLHFSLQPAESSDPAALLEQARAQHAAGVRLFVVNAPATTLKQLSAALPDSLLYNAGSADDALRSETCLNNVLHTLPSRAMLADALAQYLAAMRWNRVLLIQGPTADDRAYAAAIQRASKRFGLKIVAQKDWTFDSDQRRTAQAEMPLFTQTAEYDVVLVADERGDFGEYVPYHTWYPRPVGGTQGMTATAWHKMVESNGAAQLQDRFEQLAGRWMNDRDYAAWIAVRAIATVISAQPDADAAGVRRLSLSEQVPLAGFKGRKLTFRPWNGQLRQPIPVVHPRSLISTSPQDGFLHPVSELDTLGFDRPESRCRLNEKEL